MSFCCVEKIVKAAIVVLVIAVFAQTAEIPVRRDDPAPEAQPHQQGPGDFTQQTNPATPAVYIRAVFVPSDTGESRKKSSERIVGGAICPPNAIPYQIDIGTFNTASPFCGGTLISPNYVLTAAHCTPTDGPQYINVVFDGIHTSCTLQTRIISATDGYTIHPGWNRETLENNLALVHLSDPIPIDSQEFALTRSDLLRSGLDISVDGFNRISSQQIQWITNITGITI